MKFRLENNYSNLTFVNTLIYFWGLSLVVMIVESFENKHVYEIFWHFVSNAVNFIVLATTIFLITLNNPIKKENIKKSKIKLWIYKLFLFCNIVITIISPIVIINSESLNYIRIFWNNIIFHHEKFHIHFNMLELLLIIICIIIFTIPLVSAKIFNTVDDSDDDLVENLAQQFENVVEQQKSVIEIKKIK